MTPKLHSNQFRAGATTGPATINTSPADNYYWKAQANCLGYTQE